MNTLDSQHKQPIKIYSGFDADRAQSLVDRRYELNRRRRIFERFIPFALVASGVTITAGYLGTKIYGEFNKQYVYSKTTHEVVASPGEGLEGIAKTVVQFGKPADLRAIEQQIVNMNPDLLNGVQSGEAVEVPDSVTTN